jgi:hypothetical protein
VGIGQPAVQREDTSFGAIAEQAKEKTQSKQYLIKVTIPRLF